MNGKMSLFGADKDNFDFRLINSWAHAVWWFSKFSGWGHLKTHRFRRKHSTFENSKLLSQLEGCIHTHVKCRRVGIFDSGYENKLKISDTTIVVPIPSEDGSTYFTTRILKNPTSAHIVCNDLLCSDCQDECLFRG
jgi:hypothetical protein